MQKNSVLMTWPLIIDDPLKPDEAVSESQRRKANECYDNTLYSRLNDKQQGRPCAQTRGLGSTRRK
jgi:hypothetical protein